MRHGHLPWSGLWPQPNPNLVLFRPLLPFLEFNRGEKRANFEILRRSNEADRGRTVETLVSTQVRIAPLDAAEVAWYVDTGEPLDKAGSYAVQGLGSLFVEEVQGNYANVVGLPIPAVSRLFAELGYDLRAFSTEPPPRRHP